MTRALAITVIFDTNADTNVNTNADPDTDTNSNHQHLTLGLNSAQTLPLTLTTTTPLTLTHPNLDAIHNLIRNPKPNPLNAIPNPKPNANSYPTNVYVGIHNPLLVAADAVRSDHAPMVLGAL